jgi:hypothetical protein
MMSNDSICYFRGLSLLSTGMEVIGSEYHHRPHQEGRHVNASDVANFEYPFPHRAKVLKDTLYERFGLHSQNPYDECQTLA